jgi:hypothetical protein
VATCSEKISLISPEPSESLLEKWWLMVVNGGYLVEKHPKNAEESHKMALANLICSRTTMKIGLGSFDDLDT